MSGLFKLAMQAAKARGTAAMRGIQAVGGRQFVQHRVSKKGVAFTQTRTTKGATPKKNASKSRAARKLNVAWKRGGLRSGLALATGLAAGGIYSNHRREQKLLGKLKEIEAGFKIERDRRRR